MKVTKDYQMMGATISKGTILEYVGPSEPSGSVYVDKKGNKFNFDNSELIFSGCFRSIKREAKPCMSLK